MIAPTVVKESDYAKVRQGAAIERASAALKESLAAASPSNPQIR